MQIGKEARARLRGGEGLEAHEHNLRNNTSAPTAPIRTPTASPNTSPPCQHNCTQSRASTKTTANTTTAKMTRKLGPHSPPHHRQTHSHRHQFDKYKWVNGYEKVITTRIMVTDKEATTNKYDAGQAVGTGVSGGTEAIAIFHLLIEDLWHKDITKPIAIVQVDQKSCFDSLNICALTQP